MTAAAAGPLSQVAGGVPGSSSSMSSALGKKSDVQVGVGGRVAAASTNWRSSTLSGTRLKTSMAPEGYENGHSSNHKGETRAVASDPKVKTTTIAPGSLFCLLVIWFHHCVLFSCSCLCSRTCCQNVEPFGRGSGSRTGYPRCCHTTRAGYGRTVLALYRGMCRLPIGQTIYMTMAVLERRGFSS